MNLAEKIFKLDEHNTNIKTELTAGLTTFFTMSYLFVLSPKILENAGLEFASTLTVTAVVVFIGSILTAFMANRPYAIAPLIGETAFIAYTISISLGFSIKTSLAAIALCGVLLLIMTLTNVRTYIVNQIPENIKLSFCTGLGLFFIFIALRDIGIVKFTEKSIPLEIGNFASFEILSGLFCFLLIIILVKRKVQGAVIISIIAATVLGIIFQEVPPPEKIVSLPASIAPSLFQTDFTRLLDKNFIPILFVIFIMVNIDTAGAIIALSYCMHENEAKHRIAKENKVQEYNQNCNNTKQNDEKQTFENQNTKQPNNTIQNLSKQNNDKKTMIADSLMVIFAPLLGTTTPGAYVDSMTGINAGGRTGLSALTIGFLFLAGLIFTPLITIIPPYAYAPALLYVGILMTSAITKLDFNDISESAPALLTICIMIFTYNIGAGIIAGFIIYPLVKLLCGQKEKTNIITWIMFAVSIIFFIIYPY